MQITNNGNLLERRHYGKGLTQSKLKFREALRDGDPKVVAQVMDSLLGAKDLHPHVQTLGQFIVFDSTKRKLNMPIGYE